MTKAPTPTEKSIKQRDNTKMPPKTSITQRLRTDLGRTVGGNDSLPTGVVNRFTGSQRDAIVILQLLVTNRRVGFFTFVSTCNT